MKKLTVALMVLGIAQVLAACWWAAWLGTTTDGSDAYSYPFVLGIQGFVFCLASPFMWDMDL